MAVKYSESRPPKRDWFWAAPRRSDLGHRFLRSLWFLDLLRPKSMRAEKRYNKKSPAIFQVKYRTDGEPFWFLWQAWRAERTAARQPHCAEGIDLGDTIRRRAIHPTVVQGVKRNALCKIYAHSRGITLFFNHSIIISLQTAFVAPYITSPNCKKVQHTKLISKLYFIIIYSCCIIQIRRRKFIKRPRCFGTPKEFSHHVDGLHKLIENFLFRAIPVFFFMFVSS